MTTSVTLSGLPAGVLIGVGTASTLEADEDNAPQVIIGSQGRWILAASDTESALSAASTETAVTAEDGAELYVAGWKGQDMTMALDSSWAGKTILVNSSMFLSRATMASDGTLTITRRPWDTMPGLDATEVVREAESFYIAAAAGETSEALADAGTKYLRTVVVEANTIQNGENIAREIDASVFSVGYSGILSAADRAQRRIQDRVLMHERKPLLGESNWYWWLDAGMGQGKQGRLCSGSGWTSDETFYGGTIGVDWRFAEQWTASLAVSGESSDLDTSGHAKKATGSLTMAAASAAVTYFINDTHRLHLAATYSQTQAEAKRVTVGWREKTEPEIRMLSVDAGWSARLAVAENVTVTPSLFVGVDEGRMKKGETTLSNQDSTTSGPGFVQSAKKRTVFHVKSGLAAGAKYDVLGYGVEPGMNAGLTLFAGNTDWKVTSRLAEGSAESSAAFYSTGSWAAEAGLSLRITSESRKPVMEGGIFGFGARDTGKTRPDNWSFDVWGSVSAGAYGARSSSVGVRYKENFW